MRLDLHFKCSLWPQCKEDKREPEDMGRTVRLFCGLWEDSGCKRDWNIFRRQNQQDLVMTAHGVSKESGMSLRLLTLISLTFKVLYIPRFGVIN